MLAHIWRIINRNTISATKIKDGKLPIWLIFDLGMIARNLFVFDNNIIAELAAKVNNLLFDAVDSLFRIRQMDGEPGLRYGNGWPLPCHIRRIGGSRKSSRVLWWTVVCVW